MGVMVMVAYPGRCRTALLLVAFVALSFAAVSGCFAQSPGAQTTAQTGVKASAKMNAQMRRIDFRLDGASCAACIARIERRLQAEAGVKQAGISIYKPHYGTVFIAPGGTSFVELARRAAAGERGVALVSLREQWVDRVPAVIVPFVPPAGAPQADSAAGERQVR